MKFMWEKVENIVRKGENTGYRHLLLFPRCFQKLSYPEALNSGLFGKELILNITHIVSRFKKNDRTIMLLSEI